MSTRRFMGRWDGLVGVVGSAAEMRSVSHDMLSASIGMDIGLDIVSIVGIGMGIVDIGMDIVADMATMDTDIVLLATATPC